ncbi:general transcription factor 3C polypeptide 5-like [Anser cygnoides]|uniref:general transcription factor 3C polypeptide 5-like n=1 Tax=Anser cygnoides TaxID=8845 RepID=UPI0034D20611
MAAQGERWVWDAQGEALARGCPGGRAGYGMLPPLQVKRPQLPQPPLTGLASQTPHQLHSPALDVLLVVRGPELNPAPEVRPQQSRAQGDIASLALLAAQFLTPATWAHRGSCSGEHQPAWRRRPPQRHAPQPAPLKALRGSLGGAANGLAAGFGSRDPARAVTEAAFGRFRFPTSTMLLRVRRRTRRNKTQVDTEEPVQPEVRFEMEIVGIVTTVYKFQGMSDFQYLAMHSGPDGKQTSMYDKVLMLKPEKEEFFNRELPLYIPPPIFSRLDTPVDYFYRPDTQHRDGYNNPQVSGENLIGLSRARRPHNAIFLNFDEEEVPTKPLDAAVQTWKKVCTNAVDRKVEEELRKLFEIRPVWSRNAVKANVNIHPDKLKLLLPYLAYSMVLRSHH